MPRDKQLHFIFGFLISLMIGVLFCNILGLISSIIIGAGKEWIYDKSMPWHTVDKNDFYLTCIGGLLAFIILMILT